MTFFRETFGKSNSRGFQNPPRAIAPAADAGHLFLWGGRQKLSSRDMSPNGEMGKRRERHAHQSRSRQVFKNRMRRRKDCYVSHEELEGTRRTSPETPSWERVWPKITIRHQGDECGYDRKVPSNLRTPHQIKVRTWMEGGFSGPLRAEGRTYATESKLEMGTRVLRCQGTGIFLEISWTEILGIHSP